MRTSGRWWWLAGVWLMLLTVGGRATMAEMMAAETMADKPPATPSCRLRAFMLVEQGVLTTEQRDVVREEVARIWTPYGLAIEWRTVAGVHVPGTVSIMVRETFSNAAKASRIGSVAIAWTMFAEGGPLPFIRASVSAARAVATAARVGGRDVMKLPETLQQDYIARVLGRSIAHEIGHYLLGKKHAEFGLMRATIPPDDYFRARMNFALTRAEVAALPRSPIWQACTSGAGTRIPPG